MTISHLLAAITACAILILTSGCSSSDDPSADSDAPIQTSTPAQAAPDAQDPAAPAATDRADRPAAAPRREFKPVRLGGAPADPPPRGDTKASQNATDPHANPEFARLKDLQIVLGEWRGTTRRKFGDFNSLETVRWKWDLLTDQSQPALVFDTTDSPYLQSARLTYDADRQKFQLAATDKDGVQRLYEGQYTREPQLVPGDDPKKLERVFKLQLDQIEPADDRELTRIVFNQQSNNRYLVELYRRRGERVVIYDMIANQREGTSFALVDEGYGERTCVISEGLGTMTVTHNGRTYYVCCTGCQAAFEENPEYWIAKAEERKVEGK